MREIKLIFSYVLLYRSTSLKRASAPEARYPDVLLLQKHVTNTCFCSRSTLLTRASVGPNKINTSEFHWGDMLLLPVARITFHDVYSFGAFFIFVL